MLARLQGGDGLWSVEPALGEQSDTVAVTGAEGLQGVEGLGNAELRRLQGEALGQHIGEVHLVDPWVTLEYGNKLAPKLTCATQPDLQSHGVSP